MPSINTLVEDIYGLFRKGNLPQVNPEFVRSFSEKVAARVQAAVTEQYRPRLRLSNVGKPCLRQLWYELHVPDQLEHLPPQDYIKFIFGHILEELLLFFAKVAGHEVTDEQKEVSLGGIVGHIDGRIDGHLVDCKSASPAGFDKFKNGLSASSDSFGYLSQLSVYGNSDGEDQGSFLAINKVSGEITLDTHNLNKAYNDEYVGHVQAVMEAPQPPKRGFSDELQYPTGPSGNRKLGVACSYCAAKHLCWPGLRGFAYANGPVYLTHIEKEPRESVKEFRVG